MIELPKNFTPDQIDELIEATFKPTINLNRITSFGGEMICTESKVYLLPQEYGALFAGKCFEYSEVLSYKRSLIAGYVIQLKSGQEVRLSNVFGKMRAGITEVLDRHTKA
jgi:hypothetical protein